MTNRRPSLLGRATQRRELFGTGQVGLIPKRPWPNLVTDLDGIFGTSLTTTILTDLGFDGVLVNVTPEDLYPATIYTLDGDGVADWQPDFNSGGLLDSLTALFVQHADYLGLTSTQIADATTSTDVDLTNIDISDNINSLDAFIGALDNGIGSSGLFESLFQSLELYLTSTF